MAKVEDFLEKLVQNNLYARYSGILALSNIPVGLADAEGSILLEFNPSPDFCKLICQTGARCVCEDYLSQFEKGTTGRFVCRFGLDNILLPIIISGKIAGYVIGLQSYDKEVEYKKYLIDTAGMPRASTMERDEIAKLVSTLGVVEKSKIDVHEQLCYHIAKNIEMDLSHPANKDVARLSIEKEILEKKILDLEAKNMSLVINPHFLFNTLNTIARIAYFEKSHATEELIYCLSDLLRYNLRQKDQLHTIESEIDNTAKYLNIQKVRFKNRLEYTIDVPNSIKHYRIPNMVLQPIVENALIHGITPKRDGGHISILAEKYKDIVTLSVTDNGHGFSTESLKQINASEENSGLGMKSADQRLKRYFGQEYGIKVARSDYSGSTVVITIPSDVNAGCYR